MKQNLLFPLLTTVSLIIIQCSSGPGSVGSDYYISSTGDDESKGTSPEQAWKTIKKVNTLDLKSGDRVLFEGGTTFSGSLKLDMDDSGTPELPVTISSYGTGRATINSGSEDGLNAQNTSGIVIRDLTFKGAGVDVETRFSGINFFTNLDTVKPAFIRIENVEVSGYRWDGIAFNAERKGASGFRDVRISHASVHDIGDKGIATGGPQPPGDWSHKDFYVGHCQVFNVRGISGKPGHSGNGIIVSSLDGGLIEYCVAHNNGEFSDDMNSGGPIGIWAWDSRNVIFQFCEAYDNKTGNRADGGGFDLDGGCVGCIMQYNYSHDNDGAGYGIYQYNNAREFRDNIIRYNISENDGLKTKHSGINLWSTNSSGGMKNTQIYNNTIFVGDSAHGAAIEEFPDEPGQSFVYNTAIYNNIFVSVAGKELINIPNPSDEWTFAGNCYYTYGDKVRIKWGDETFSSMDQWRVSTGQETVNGEDVGWEADPELIQPGSAGTVGDPEKHTAMQSYRLNNSSPVIDLGLNLRKQFGWDIGKQDFFGNELNNVQKFDMGAHEFMNE